MDKKFFTFHALHDRPSDSLSMGLPYTSYSSFGTISPQFSQGSPYYDTDSISGESRKIRKKRNTYQKIDDETRRKLLEAVKEGDTLKAASRRFNINYSSAKSILHTYRKEGRITKKSAQERARNRTKIPSDLEASPLYLMKLSQENLDEVHDSSTHHSLEENSPVYEQSEDEGPQISASILAPQSFGDFLKVKSHVQSSQSAETNPKRREIYNEEPCVSQFIGEPCNEIHNTPKSPYKTVHNEGFYLNYSASPLSQIGKMKKEESSVSKDYGTYAEVRDFDDISYFLNSSPAYGFQKGSYGNDQYGVDHSSGTNQQDAYYDDFNKSSYFGEHSLKIEETAASYF